MTFSLRSARLTISVGVLLAALTLTGCSQVSAVIEQVLPEHTGAHTLVVGECFNNTVSILTAEDDVVGVPRENCTLEHDNEVIASVQLDDKVFPGDDAVATQGVEGCLNEFEEFIGIGFDEAGTLGYNYFAPTAASWKLGDREILCFAFDSAAQTAYTLKAEGAERAASAGESPEAEPEGDS